MEFDVVVEVPKGSRNKYEVDPKTGRIYLDRMLFVAARYPADYGFIPETEAQDGDPLDAMVLVDEPTFPGCHVRCRPVGLFRMRDEKGPDAKVLAVPASDPRFSAWLELADVPEHLLLEIHHFFEIYKDLEPGKMSRGEGWSGRPEAEAELERARSRYRARAV